jgi:hypothetical protein
MRGAATLAIVFGLLGGLLGMVAFNELSGRAGATGSVTEQAEVVVAVDGGFQWQGWDETYLSSRSNITTIDTTKFPSGTTFTFNVTAMESTDDSSHCMRLAEVTPPPNTLNPVSGSEVCTPLSMSGEIVALQSGPLTLSSGNHMYMLQVKEASGDGWFDYGVARVVAEWQDYPPPVGGIAVLPNLSNSYLVVAGLAALMLLAFSARYARRRGRADTCP